MQTADKNSMKNKTIDFLANILPIIYPQFYISTDLDGNELVFLDIGLPKDDITNKKFDKTAQFDKTAYESFENHFHLFGKINKKDEEVAIKIGKTISQNLLNALQMNFPDKIFIVYLTVNIKDSTIIRFHQEWNNEPPYFDSKAFSDEYIFEFKTLKNMNAKA
ncbi:MAG: hypothetical protein LBJ31_11500 [Treponema sp.]|jgi:hypothetical protein|nr:hypothetical protein [Treponema sp.]